jgi:hypothetical protein
MWRRVDLVWIDVSEEGIASIFRVEKSASEEPAWRDGYPEDGGDTFLRNVGSHKIYTEPHPRTRHSSLQIQSKITLSFQNSPIKIMKLEILCSVENISFRLYVF